MEEKRTKIHNFFRSIYGSGYSPGAFYSSPLRKFFSPLFRLIDSNGFTLVELLISIAIIGILASAVTIIINPQAQFQKSHDGQRKADLKVIQSALELYRSDLGAYPQPNLDDTPGVANCPLSAPSSLVDNSQDPSCTAATTANDTTYLQNVPVDPTTGDDYYYCRATTCGGSAAGYALFSCLENTKDTSGIAPTGVPAGVSSNMKCARYYKVVNP